jgi:hypothetical protein
VLAIQVGLHATPAPALVRCGEHANEDESFLLSFKRRFVTIHSLLLNDFQKVVLLGPPQSIRVKLSKSIPIILLDNFFNTQTRTANSEKLFDWKGPAPNL